MGLKPWHHWGLLAFAGIALAGCNSNPSRPAYDTKGPPSSPQTTQRPSPFPNGANTNQQFPLVQNQPPAPQFNTNSKPAVPSGQAPTINNGFPQGPGVTVPTQSQSFTPPQPSVPSFPPLPANSSVQLPTNVSRTQLPSDTTLFQNAAPTGVPGLPPPPAGNLPLR